MLSWCILLTVAAPCLASRETHRFVHIAEDGKAVAQDIIHDITENTVMVTIGDVSMYTGYIPTVNLHDFNTRFVAFKDIRRQSCIVARTPYPNAMPELYRLGISNITKTYTAKGSPQPLTYEQVVLLAGPKIADFCKEYSTYMRELIPTPPIQKRGQTDVASSEAESGNIWCVFCRICLKSEVSDATEELAQKLQPDHNEPLIDLSLG